MEYSNKYFIIFLFLLLIPYYSVLHYEPEEAPKYAKSFLAKNIEKNVEITKADKREENIKFYVNAGSYWNKTSVEIETEILYKPKYIDEATDLIFGVKSEWKKRERRDAVRNTYGNPVHYKKYGFTAKFVFLFGLPPNGSYLSELEEHDDIIVGDFHDSFQNLTYKDSMFFTWTYEAVPNLLFCYKGDDDILLNPFKFSEVLLSHKHVVDPVLWGNRGQGPRLGEDYIGSGWDKYVDLVFNEDYYPPYVSGASLFMNKAAVDVIKENIRKMPMIPIDDAFLGICLREGGYSGNHVVNVPQMIKFLAAEKMDICVIENSKAIHKFKPDQLECIWPLFLKHRSKCGTEEEKKILTVGHVCDPVMFWYESANIKEPLGEDHKNYGRCGGSFNFSSCYKNKEDWNNRNSGPCCSPNGFCGLTHQHCACDTCFDARTEEMKEMEFCCKHIEISFGNVGKNFNNTLHGRYILEEDEDGTSYYRQYTRIEKSTVMSEPFIDPFYIRREESGWVVQTKEGILANAWNYQEQSEKCIRLGKLGGQENARVWCVEY